MAKISKIVPFFKKNNVPEGNSNASSKHQFIFPFRKDFMNNE